MTTVLRWRKPVHETCRHCNTPTVTGSDRDRAALTVTVDPHPLTWGGELSAVYLQHRDTYQLTPHGLYHRAMPAQRPAGHPVVTTHRCRDPVPDAWHAPTPAPPPTTATTLTDGVPY